MSDSAAKIAKDAVTEGWDADTLERAMLRREIGGLRPVVGELASVRLRLDPIADRLGEVYQWVGQLQHDHAIQDDRVTKIMDELVQLCEDVETISLRQKREGP